MPGILSGLFTIPQQYIVLAALSTILGLIIKYIIQKIEKIEENLTKKVDCSTCNIIHKNITKELEDISKNVKILLNLHLKR